MLLACLLSACDIGGGVPPEPSAAPGSPAPTGRPHFTGTTEVTLRTGRIYYSEEPCPPTPTDDKVCDPEGSRAYLLFGEPARARVVEARMDLVQGGTSWTATTVFSRDSGATLRRMRELARSSGAVVLVLGRAGHSLLVAPVTRVEGRRITYPDLSKPEAWDTVERFTDP